MEKIIGELHSIFGDHEVSRCEVVCMAGGDRILYQIRALAGEASTYSGEGLISLDEQAIDQLVKCISRAKTSAVSS
jgi:hypothetical protein